MNITVEDRPKMVDGTRFITNFNKRIPGDISDERWWFCFHLELAELHKKVEEYNQDLAESDLDEIENRWMVGSGCFAGRLIDLAKEGAEWEMFDFGSISRDEDLLDTFLDSCDWDLQDQSNHPRIALGLEDA